MITVNGENFPWEQGLTITKLLELKGWTLSIYMIVVRINNKVISEQEFDTTYIKDGDAVLALHFIGGG